MNSPIPLHQIISKNKKYNFISMALKIKRHTSNMPFINTSTVSSCYSLSLKTEKWQQKAKTKQKLQLENLGDG